MSVCGFFNYFLFYFLIFKKELSTSQINITSHDNINVMCVISMSLSPAKLILVSLSYIQFNHDFRLFVLIFFNSTQFSSALKFRRKILQYF